MSNSIIAVIVEGTVYEKRILHNIESNFFNKRLGCSNIEVLPLPVGINIYMLWNKMKDSDFDIDIIEVLKELSSDLAEKLDGYKRKSIGEVYLFFDLDKQQNNLPKGQNAQQVVQKMLDYFDNETEHGKLYISYPMAEAIRDYVPASCFAATGKCYISGSITNYKDQTKGNDEVVNVNKFTLASWSSIVSCFLARMSCLFDKEEFNILASKQYGPKEIYKQQTVEGQHVPYFIILSAFPEFLIDYFTEESLQTILSLPMANMCEERFNG